MYVNAPEFLQLQAALAGEYSLQRELGRGGMGIVYLARDVQLDRDVAIKVLPAPLAALPASRERFLREARMAAGLSHPHIVPIHRVGEAGGLVFFVMTYVEGETLGERLRARGPLPPAEAARVLREVAWALAYAHGRGVVHRDVKPDNILLEAGTGRALVTDFGIAQGHDAAQAITDPGRIMGTAHFMSPEQAAGEPVDRRGDIYALGVVGYLALSGRLPFEAPSVPALLVRQASEAPPALVRTAPGVPSALAAVIDACLARDPGDRFQDAEALADALAPAPEARPALPPTLRGWLSARNPLLVPYLGWSSGFSVLTLGNVYANATHNPGSSWGDVALLATLAVIPAFPIVGFHLNQAYRQFRAGHSLADLRTAIDVARRERAETDALEHTAGEPRSYRLLRLATVASGTWLATTFGLALGGVVHERQIGMWFMVVPMLTTLLLGAASNALDIPFIPDRIRAAWRSGIRDRLWSGRIGEWFARRLGAPERSRAIGAGAFRATESALGVAASELFAALPASHREHLAELPATVAALESRAAEARAELELLDALVGRGGGGSGARGGGGGSGARGAGADAGLLAARRAAAASQLADTVAALEGIRLDLLRLHAGAPDLAPLTTLLDAARLLGEDVNRLADAEREVEDGLARDRAPRRSLADTP